MRKWMKRTATVVFVARPMPLPAVPPPVKLEGELLLHGGTTNGLVVAPNPTFRLTGSTGTTIDSAESFSPDTDDTADSVDTPDPADSLDNANDDSLDTDSVDSPDD